MAKKKPVEIRRKGTRGRKAPSTLYWEDKFFGILRKIHGTHYRGAFHKIMKKASSTKASLKRRSAEFEVLFDLELNDIKRMILRAYGKPCRYCKNELMHRNMAFDHKEAISSGGPSTKANLHIICRRCNTRKGPMSHEDYLKFLDLISVLDSESIAYIFRKLASREVF